MTRPVLTARNRARRGHSVVEVALMAPWIFFLFVGIFDFGFFAYAMICTQNAARAGALHASANPGTATDFTTTCQYAINELARMPNVSATTPCTGTPVAVTLVGPIAGADGEQAAQVQVTYQTVPLIPIPGLLSGQMTITRTVQMPLRTT